MFKAANRSLDHRREIARRTRRLLGLTGMDDRTMYECERCGVQNPLVKACCLAKITHQAGNAIRSGTVWYLCATCRDEVIEVIEGAVSGKRHGRVAARS